MEWHGMARHGAAPHELEKWPAFPLERYGTATAATTIPRLEIEIERERETTPTDSRLLSAKLWREVR